MLALPAFGYLAGAVFQVVGLTALLYGMRRASCVACAGAGAVLGLCLYSYLGHRLMILPGLLVAMVYLCRGRDPLRQRVTVVCSFLFGLLVITIPWLSIVCQQPDLWWGDSRELGSAFHEQLRQDPLGALHEAAYAIGALLTTLLHHHQGAAFGYILQDQHGLLDTVTAILFFLGIIYALLTVRRPATPSPASRCAA